MGTHALQLQLAAANPLRFHPRPGQTKTARGSAGPCQLGDTLASQTPSSGKDSLQWKLPAHAEQLPAGLFFVAIPFRTIPSAFTQSFCSRGRSIRSGRKARIDQIIISTLTLLLKRMKVRQFYRFTSRVFTPCLRLPPCASAPSYLSPSPSSAPPAPAPSTPPPLPSPLSSRPPTPSTHSSTRSRRHFPSFPPLRRATARIPRLRSALLHSRAIVPSLLNTDAAMLGFAARESI
jgi:hypothetical protein